MVVVPERTDRTVSSRRVLQGLMFYPRGGSAQVARYLSRSLATSEWETTLLTGSLGEAGEPTHAATFFAGINTHALDYTAAYKAEDPLAGDPPMHPSFEDRPGAPDRVCAKADDAAFERLVAAWGRGLQAAGAGKCEVLHLHHLTPINEAARRFFPDIPVVGHLHGTELMMLEEIAEGADPSWTHAEAWAERMRDWARGCERLVVLSKDALGRVPELLGVDRERLRAIGNGVDLERFGRRPVRGEERRALWRRWLVDGPQGWDESGRPGSIAYTDEDLHPFSGDACVLLYVGRFTAVKRIPLMIRAYERARSQFVVPAPLVLLGGHPGEWEGKHPARLVEERAIPDVFFAGWRGHEDLPDGLNAADVIVLASVHEQFGQVLIEGMACGLPAIAVDAHGPAEIIDHGETGWLVGPDDEDALVRALVTAVNANDERVRLGHAAHQVALEQYGWPALATEVAALYEEVAGRRRAPASGR